MRCRNCEEPIEVLDLCEICEMEPVSILPEEMRLCDRGHPMTQLHSEWRCVVCRRMRQTKYRAERRRIVKSPEVAQ